MGNWDEKIVGIMAIFGLCLAGIVASTLISRDPFTALSLGTTAIGSLITGIKIGEAKKLV